MRLLSLWIAIAFLLVSVHSAAAGAPGLDRRQEDLDSETATKAVKPESDAGASQTEPATITSTTAATEASTTETGTTASDATTQTAGPDATTTKPAQPSSTSNQETKDKLDPDRLPLEPRISPAFAITGVVLLITGVVYTLIGIKKRWAQVFLSTGYLAALSVAVLIVYVMNTPVPDARQGGYFVACFLTGVIFGGVSLVFQEITEGMGCLLGGFCLSMWLLTLKPGGLLPETSAKVAFIAAFTAASYATSFTHYTRPYALIGATSFAGATATILGIDCFSRAGLKEFWLYIWGLNPDAFPLNTTTYPITRGIRVELAGIVVVCFIGIISQIKLWKLVSERRKAKLAAKADEEQQRDREEEEAGRNLEEANSREMAAWEAIYEPDSDKQKADSGIGGDDSAIGKEDGDQSSCASRTEEAAVETRRGDTGEGVATSAEGRSSTLDLPKRNSGVRNQGACEVSPSEDGAAGVESGLGDIRGDSTTNRMSNMSTAASADFNVVPPSPGGSHPMSRAQESQQFPRERLPDSMPPAPSVTPLPFKIPLVTTGGKEEDEMSVAASAGSDIDMNEFSRRFSRLSNFTRLSGVFGGSTSNEPVDEPTSPSGDRSRPASGAVVLDSGHSTKTGSVPEEAGYELRTTPSPAGEHWEVPIDPQDFTTAISQGLEKAISQGADDKTERSSINIRLSGVSEPKDSSSRPVSSVMLSVPLTESEKKTQGSTGSGRRTPAEGNTSPDPIKKPESAARSTVSRAGSLTAGAVKELPSQASSITMSYRTNEWAKHLSRADIPPAEPIQEPTLQDGSDDTSLQEEPVRPVDVLQLQQTALDAHPPPMVEHYNAATATSDDSNPPRPDLLVSKNGLEEEPQSDSQPQSSGPTRHLRPSSQPMPNKALSTPNSLHTVVDGNPSANGYRNSSTPFLANSVHGSVIREASEWETPGDKENSPSPLPPLMALRDSMVRNRMSSSFINRNSSAPSLSKHQQAFADASVAANRNSRQSFALPDDDMPLAQRREIIRQQSFNGGEPVSFSSPKSVASYDYSRPGTRSPFPQLSRQAPHPELQREANLAAWRESVREEIAKEHAPRTTVDNRRADMLMEKRQSARGKQQESMMAQYRDQALTEAMQRGDMQHLHREAMRKMQAQANKPT